MINKYLLLVFAATPFAAQSMEKQFDIKEIIALAKITQAHQPFIEACFAQQLLGEKHMRDLGYTKLQSSINNEMRASSCPDTVKQCLLTHLRLAYYKKELEYHQQALTASEQEIRKLSDALSGKK